MYGISVEVTVLLEYHHLFDTRAKTLLKYSTVGHNTRNLQLH